MSKRNRGHRDILEDLESQEKPLEVVLLAWSILEMIFTDALLKAFALSTQVPKSKWLINLNFASKFKLLNLMEILPDKDYDTIQTFKRERDELFHRGGLFFPNYDEAKKSELVNRAIAAVDAAWVLYDRMLNLPSGLAKALK